MLALTIVHHKTQPMSERKQWRKETCKQDPSRSQMIKPSPTDTVYSPLQADDLLHWGQVQLQLGGLPVRGAAVPGGSPAVALPAAVLPALLRSGNESPNGPYGCRLQKGSSMSSIMVAFYSEKNNFCCSFISTWNILLSSWPFQKSHFLPFPCDTLFFPFFQGAVGLQRRP